MTEQDDVKTSDKKKQASTGVIESINPATGELVGTVPVMGSDDVERTVQGTRETSSWWSQLDLKARAAHLRKIRQAIVDRGVDLARMISKETGKPLADAWFEVFAACLLLTYAAHTAPKVLRPHSVSTWPVMAKKGSIHYSPYGVVGVISPWNYPLAVPMQAAASALGAGNAVVLKPSELTPLTGVLLGEVVASTGSDLVTVVTGMAAPAKRWSGRASIRSPSPAAPSPVNGSWRLPRIH